MLSFSAIHGKLIGSGIVLALVCSASVYRLSAQEDAKAGDNGQGHHSIGFVAGDEATSKDVGLPVYPGAQPYKEKDNDSSSANLGLWGGAMGFRLAIMKLETGDSPDKVASFYRKALSRYGSVLDCTNAQPVKKSDSDSSKALTCEDDKPEPGGILLKSGTKQAQHVVGIEPRGGGTHFQLIYLFAK